MTAETVISCLSTLFLLFDFSCYIQSDRGRSFVSKEWRIISILVALLLAPPLPTSQREIRNVKEWTRQSGAPFSCFLKARISPIIAGTMYYLMLCIPSGRSCALQQTQRHTNAFCELSTAISAWKILPVLVSLPWSHCACSKIVKKQHPLVEDVQLLEANSQLSRVLSPDGREATVSTSDLAPSGQQEIDLD